MDVKFEICGKINPKYCTVYDPGKKAVLLFDGKNWRGPGGFVNRPRNLKRVVYFKIGYGSFLGLENVRNQIARKRLAKDEARILTEYQKAKDLSILRGLNPEYPLKKVHRAFTKPKP